MKREIELKALVVDDDPVARRAVELSLLAQAFACDLAVDGQQALQQIALTQYDLIVTDLRMPRKHGHALAIELLGRQPTPLLVVHSAVSDPRLYEDLLRRGVDDIISKPTDYRLFAAKMRALVERRRAGHDHGGTAAERKSAPSLEKPAKAAGAPARKPAPPGKLPSKSPISRSIGADSLMELGKMKFLMLKSEVLKRIDRCIEVKTMSPILTKLLGMLDAPGCSMKDVAQTIRQDQALCLKVLKLANSCVYSQGTHVDSVEKAVMRIGTGQIRQTIMNIGIVELFSADARTGGLDLRQFWEHSMAVGLIAAQLCRAVQGNPADVELSFTQGLLHDIGRAVLAEQLGGVYEQVAGEAQKLDLPLELAEKQLIQIDHTEAAHRVLTSWRFSKQLLQPIQRHHQAIAAIRQLPPAALRESAILILANRIARALLLGRSGNESMGGIAEVATLLKLSDDAVKQVLAEIPERLEDLKMAMLSSAAANAHWPTVAEEYRSRLRKNISPAVISVHATLDEIGLLVWALFPEESRQQAPANLGIVHMMDESQAPELAEKLREMETQSGAGPLPLVVFSPGARLTLGPEAVGSRPCVQVSSSTSISRILDALLNIGSATAAVALEEAPAA